MAEVEASPEAVEWVGRRADTGVEFVSRWTIERARTAGFTSNKLYESMPIEMLRAKAQSEVARTLFPDVLLGIAYSREELELEVPDTPRTVPAAGGGVDGLKQRLAARQAPATATPEPEPVQPSEPAITAAQLKKLHTLLGKWDLTDREQALAWLSQQVDRPLVSSKDIAKSEAVSLIDFIEAEQARDAEANQ